MLTSLGERPSNDALETHYELLDELGRGAMGRVLRARDRATGEVVAVKSLLPAASADDLFSLKQEFRISRGISSPHLIPIYNLVVSGRTAHVVMPLLAGTTLDRWSLLGPWYQRPDEVLGVVAGIAAGLRDLHGLGLVHRDVKPHNIIVEPDGRAVLLDYGLASRERGVDVFVTSSPEALVGTWSYLAPECIRGGPANAASDAFATGVTLTEVFAGERPIRSPIDWSVDPAWLEAHLRSLAERLPALHAMVVALLDPEPARRPTFEKISGELAEMRGVATTQRASGERRHAIVGRGAELDRIRAQFALGPGVFGVVGASGIGKTTIVAEALRTCPQERERLVLIGRSHPGESVAYRMLDPVMDELGRWLLRCEPARVRELFAGDLPILQRAFPTLARLSVDGAEPLPPGPEELRRRLPIALARLLREVDARWSLVLWLDDVHWADDDGVTLLVEVLSRFEGRGPIVVLSGRELPPALRPSVREMIALARLDSAAAMELAAQVTVEAASSLEDLLSAAEGNPALIVQLASHGERGRETDVDIAARLSRMPSAAASLRHVVASDLAGFAQEERDVVLATSLLGHPLPLAALPLFSVGLAPRRMAHRLARGGLLRLAHYRGADAIEFAHDRLRVAATELIDPPARTALHARLAESLIRMGGAEPESIAKQMCQADRRDQARPYFVAAGDQALERLAFDHAAGCFAAALEGCASPLERAALLGRLARALSLAGRIGEAADRYDEAADLAKGDEHWVLLEQAGIHYLQAARIDDGLARLRSLFARHGRRLPKSDLALLLSLGAARLRPRRHALGAYPIRPTPEPHHTALADLAFSTTTSLAQVNLALGAWMQQLHYRHGLASGSLHHVARALIVEAGFLGTSGRDARVSERLLGDAAALLERIDDQSLRALHAAMSAGVRWSSGEWASCVRFAEEAERIARTRCVGAWWALNFSRSMILDASRWMGAYDSLVERLRDYLQDAVRRGDTHARITFETRFASVAELLRDRPIEAWHACAAARQWRTSGVHLQHLTELHARAECLLYAGHPEAALRWVEQRYRGIRRSPLMMSKPPRLKVLHQLATCRLAVAAVESGGRRRALVRSVRPLERELRSVGWGYTNLLADLLAHGCALTLGQASQHTAEGLSRHALALDMRQYADALSIASDPVPGAGQRPSISTDAIARPERWAAVLIPGISPPVPPHRELSTPPEA